MRAPAAPGASRTTSRNGRVGCGTAKAARCSGGACVSAAAGAARSRIMAMPASAPAGRLLKERGPVLSR